jgi:Protein of unknown function (DUF3341)
MSGVLAGFDTEDALRHALDRLAAEHVRGVETYTPKALDEHPTGSPLPLMMFLAGVLGFVGFFLLMAYADLWAYPLDIGGRPDFAWPSFVPIAFELAVLCAMGAGFFGYFVLCRMPRPYDPIDECASFRRASRDGWFVAIRSTDPRHLTQAHAVLDALRPTSVEEFSS